MSSSRRMPHNQTDYDTPHRISQYPPTELPSVLDAARGVVQLEVLGCYRVGRVSCANARQCATMVPENVGEAFFFAPQESACHDGPTGSIHGLAAAQKSSRAGRLSDNERWARSPAPSRRHNSPPLGFGDDDTPGPPRRWPGAFNADRGRTRETPRTWREYSPGTRPGRLRHRQSGRRRTFRRPRRCDAPPP